MNKNILLVGGSKGIGLAVAQELQFRYNLYSASRTNESLQNLKATHIPFNATNDTMRLDQLPKTLDGFVYFPGCSTLRPFKRMTQEILEENMRLNFFSLARVVRDILPKLSQNASLVFYSTVAVGLGMPFHTSIAAAKGAIEGFARSLAAEYAPRLRANVIAPSLVETTLTENLLNSEKKKETIAKRHPLHWIGTPADIANFTIFLLSDKSSWMTGQVVSIDGEIGNLKIN